MESDEVSFKTTYYLKNLHSDQAQLKKGGTLLS